jgi:4-hydroxythreonine-4-phosphate dehydrogenase
MTEVSPLVLSMGEPAGIGPDVILAAWASARRDLSPFVAIADPDLLAARARALGLSVPLLPVAADALGTSARRFAEALPVLPVTLPCPNVLGAPDPANSPQVAEAIRAGVALCREGRARGLVTAPIHKAAMAAGGFPFPGHTEFLESLAGPGFRAVMMLACEGLRVVPLTVHCALAEVPERLGSTPIAELGASFCPPSPATSASPGRASRWPDSTPTPGKTA